MTRDTDTDTDADADDGAGAATGGADGPARTGQTLDPAAAQAVASLFENVTPSIHPDDDRLTVEPTDRGIAHIDQYRTVRVNFDVADALGVEIDRIDQYESAAFSLVHEVTHDDVTDLGAKERIADEYAADGPAWQRLAADLYNIVEDVYVNDTALERKPGVARGYAVYADAMMAGVDPLASYDGPEQLLKAVFQMALAAPARAPAVGDAADTSLTAAVRGLDGADADVREFVRAAADVLEAARAEPDRGERVALVHELVDLVGDHADVPEYPGADLPWGVGGGTGRGRGGDGGADPDDGADPDGDPIEFPAGDPDDAPRNRGDPDDAPRNRGDGDGDAADGGGTNPLDRADDDDPSGLARRAAERADRAAAARAGERGLVERLRTRRDTGPTATPGVSAAAVRAEYNGELADRVRRAFGRIKTGGGSTPSRTPTADVDVRNAVRRRAGDTTAPLYRSSSPTRRGDRRIVVALDASGSMDSMPAKKALLALADAAHHMGDEFGAVAFSDTEVDLVTAPDEEFGDDHLDSFNVGGMTPTPSGIRAARQVAAEGRARDALVVVVTDGRANRAGELVDAHNPTSEDCRQLAADEVAAAEESPDPTPVLGVGVGGGVDGDYMASIFGEHIHVDMADLPRRLARAYAARVGGDASVRF